MGDAVGAVHDAEASLGEDGQRRREDWVPYARFPEGVEQGAEAEAEAQVGGAERGGGAPCVVSDWRRKEMEGCVCVCVS